MKLQKAFPFARRQRITRKKDFALLFEEGARRTIGPFLVRSRCNTLGFPRLGLSVPKRVGNAVIRNTIKRKCREAFRLSQHQLPNIDILLTVRPHKVLTTADYSSLLLNTVSK